MAPTRTTRASVRNDPAHVHCSLTPDRKPRAKKRRKSFFNLTGQGKIKFNHPYLTNSRCYPYNNTKNGPLVHMIFHIEDVL